MKELGNEVVSKIQCVSVCVRVHVRVCVHVGVCMDACCMCGCVTLCVCEWPLIGDVPTARVGFEPGTLRTQGIELTTEPPLPIIYMNVWLKALNLAPFMYHTH